MTTFLYRQLYSLVQVLRGEGVLRALDELEAGQWSEPECVREMQWAKLTSIVAHAYEHVAHYRQRFDAAGFQPSQFRSWSDFRALPTLEKADLRSRRELLEARDRNYKTHLYSSSGSTGPSSTVLVDRDTAGYRHAAVFRAYRWMGADLGDRIFQIWGTQIDSLGRVKERLTDAALHRRTFPTHQLAATHLRRWHQQMSRKRPAILYGFSSAVFEFARFIEGEGLSPLNAGAVLVTGEPLQAHQRESIERVFQTRAFVQYGAEEFGPIAYECPNGKLHLNAENILVEVEESPDPGIRGTLLLTSLRNRVMPLIRYRIGDVGMLSSDQCGCGRGLPLLDEISGRSVNFIRTPDGRILHGIHFDYLPKYFLQEIWQFQLIQNELDQLQVNWVKDQGFSERTLPRFEQALREIVGHSIRISFNPVEEIQREKTGKTCFVKTRLKD